MAPPGPSTQAQQALAQRLRQLRTDADLSQKEVGALLDPDKPLTVAAVSSWEKGKLPPHNRLKAYALLFGASATPDTLPAIDDLGPDVRGAVEDLRSELESLHRQASSAGRDLARPNNIWTFRDEHTVTIVCARLPAEDCGPYADPARDNYVQLHTFADVDALVELFGHLRAANPLSDVTFVAADKFEADDATGHVILLGGVVWNEVASQMCESLDLPVAQERDPDDPEREIFVHRELGIEPRYHRPTRRDGTGPLLQDVGMLVRAVNPYNGNCTLTVCNGVSTKGVYGAVRCQTDARLRDANSRFLDSRFGAAKNFGLLVNVPVVGMKALTPDLWNTDHVRLDWTT